MTVAFARLDGLPERQMMPGVSLRILAGDALMFSIVRFDPHATVPTHQHPHEQIGFVLEGELDLWIGGERRTLGSADLHLFRHARPQPADYAGSALSRATWLCCTGSPCSYDPVALSGSRGAATARSGYVGAGLYRFPGRHAAHPSVDRRVSGLDGLRQDILMQH